MSKRPYMPWSWADWLQDTQGFSTTEKSAYLDLRGYYWEHECLPGTYVSCQNVTGLTRRTWPRVWAKLSTKFTPNGRHLVWDAEIKRVEILKLKRRFAGEKGAALRWQLPMPFGMPEIMAKPMAIAGANLNKIDKPFPTAEEAPPVKINGNDAKPSPYLLALTEQQDRERGIKRTPSSSATAHLGGAPPPPANTQPAAVNGKAVHDLTRVELEALYAKKRPVQVLNPADEEGDIPF